MTAQIIDLPRRDIPRNPGNGARETLIDLALTLDTPGQADAERRADYILAGLWARGFKVVPVDE